MKEKLDQAVYEERKQNLFYSYIPNHIPQWRLIQDKISLESIDEILAKSMISDSPKELMKEYNALIQ